MRDPREPDLSFTSGAFPSPSPAGAAPPAADAAPAPAGAPAAVPTPFDDVVLYDRIFDALDFDVAFWTRLAREARGPVLDVGCGTGRITLPMLEAGADVDGFDRSRPMLARLEAKAHARGVRPGIHHADMRDFTLPRRYALIAIPFNAFLHNLTADDQLATLRCCSAHLMPGGALVMHVSFNSAQSILESGGPPVLELETRDPVTGHLLQHFDARTIDPVRQMQHSRNEARELDAAGRVVSSRFSEMDARWIYPAELDLLLRVAGFGRREIHGGFEREPVGANHGMMIAFAWKE